MPPEELFPPALNPRAVLPRTGSTYPEPLKARVAGRSKRSLGDAVGLKNFGVNRVHLAPGAASSIRHWHSRQDEFIYVLEGELTLITNAGEQVLQAGMAAGFPAGKADGHQLVNRSQADAVYLEVGDRLPGDEVVYPDDDLAATHSTRWSFTHKDGRSY
ncbi:cupin domain-containing protein [Phormidium sp. CLA17]|uniref:cupin domain-containing protein n=1 Tax=Leptolyngbya sp. Cla-17 TaxID=2803751 RepID=UPI001491EC1B|nr:cupin domain-containing protein [Leptolyngbya sp. Cla-17]MBM0740524.1 cupin domain-containing protein [Leptolyngbya sp. Cla-17]